MRLLNPITFDEMIAVFLKAEWAGRFRGDIEEILARTNTHHAVIKNPDVTDAVENVSRRQILKSYRAYVFEELPEHVRWYRALVTPEEVAKIRYIDYSYWNEISNHTRLPMVASEVIQSGREIFEVSNKRFLEAAKALRAGAQFPELICVARSSSERLTVFEGHLRLTAYMLAPECLPEALEIIVGFAPECAHI